MRRILAERDSLPMLLYAEHVKRLPEERAVLIGSKECLKTGIALKASGGMVVVESVCKDGLAFMSAKVGEGFVLTSVNWAPPVSIEAVKAELQGRAA